MPPVVVAAGVAAAGSIAGGAMASSGAKSAAKAAAQSNAENNALAREFRAENTANLSPFMNRGNAAGNQINALLGLGGAASSMPQYESVANPAYSAQNALDYFMAQVGPNRSKQINRHFAANPNLTAEQKLNYALPHATGQEKALYGQWVTDNPKTIQQAVKVGPAQGTADAARAAQNAFDIFRNSTGYQFRVNEGQKGINTGYAARGLIESGAAMKALEGYRQNIASDEFGRYLGYLGNQQGVGLQGASAIAGVGQNALNNMTANNSAAADARGNAALASGSAWGQGIAGAAGAVGNALGSSYGGGGLPAGMPGYGLPGGAPLPMPRSSGYPWAMS